jgi:hypothetical protein
MSYFVLKTDVVRNVPLLIILFLPFDYVSNLSRLHMMDRAHEKLSCMLNSMVGCYHVFPTERLC